MVSQKRPKERETEVVFCEVFCLLASFGGKRLLVGWRSLDFCPKKLTAKAPGKNNITGRRSGFLLKWSLFQRQRDEHFRVVAFFLNFFHQNDWRVWDWLWEKSPKSHNFDTKPNGWALTTMRDFLLSSRWFSGVYLVAKMIGTS